jgi:hypothetical protein
MPTEALFVNSVAYALPEAEMEDGDALDEEALDGIRLVFEPDADFLEMTSQEIWDMTLETSAIFQDHLNSALLVMQERLCIATEIADLIMRAEEEEPDWEL